MASDDAMNEPTTPTGKRRFARSDQIAERRLDADPTEEWVADAWAADNEERADILAIEVEAREQERKRLRAEWDKRIAQARRLDEAFEPVPHRWGTDIVDEIVRGMLADPEDTDGE